MRDLRETANKAEELLQAAGVEKYALQVKETEKRELNTELETFSRSGPSLAVPRP